jgi:hypothetical protein
MSQNWSDGQAGDGTAGEQNWSIDVSGLHDGQAEYSGKWSSVSWLEVANASPAPPSPTAEVVFDDYIGTVNSVKIQGLNQNGQLTWACFTTPLTGNRLPNFWWQENTDIWAYKSSNCGSGEVYSWPFTLTDAATSPPYNCQSDVSPYADWDPGSNWESCAISPSPNGVWHGYATGALVSSGT